MSRWWNSLLVAVTVVMAGCGAGGAATRSPLPTLASTTKAASIAPGGATAINMVFTDTKPRFLPDHVTVKAGTVVFFLENVPGDSGPYFYPTHNLQVGPALGEVLAGTPDVKVGQKVTFTVEDVTPGTYVYWCSVPTLDQKDHGRYGMVGTLTVTP